MQPANKKLLLVGVLVVFVVAAVIWGVWLKNRSESNFSSGVTAFQTGDLENAKSYFMDLVGSAHAAETYFYLGKIALGIPDVNNSVQRYPSANFKNAAVNYEKSIELGLQKVNSDLYFTALNDLGFSYQMLKDYEKADIYFLKRIDGLPKNSFVARYFVASNYFHRQNKPAEALTLLLPNVEDSNGLSSFEKRHIFRVYTLLSRLYLYNENYQDAEKYALLAIQRAGSFNNFDVQVAHLVLAQAVSSRGEFTKAIAEVKKAGELAGDPNSFSCVLSRAYIIGKKYDLAISAAKNAVKDNMKTYNYNNAICLSSLITAYNNLRQKNNAESYYKQYSDQVSKAKEKNIFVMKDLENFSKIFSQ